MFVVRFLVTPVFLFVTVTVTSGSNAPLESVTVPRMSPELVLCAKHAPLQPIRSRRDSIQHNLFFMNSLQTDLLCNDRRLSKVRISQRSAKY